MNGSVDFDGRPESLRLDGSSAVEELEVLGIPDVWVTL